jgi:inner membrane protein
MASTFGHVIASTAIGYAISPHQARLSTFLLAGFCSFAPDLDVLAFSYGIPYSSPWGHRGWTHSIVFALFFGFLAGITCGLMHKSTRKEVLLLVTWMVLSTLSHPLLDMCTNGGLGCALYWPFNHERIFFPYHPILVSPLGASAFFSQWGLEVLWSELKWIGFPALILIVWVRIIKK